MKIYKEQQTYSISIPPVDFSNPRPSFPTSYYGVGAILIKYVATWTYVVLSWAHGQLIHLSLSTVLLLLLLNSSLIN